MTQLNLFIISSPLQMVTATNIQLQFPPTSDVKSILFIEGDSYYQPIADDIWDDIVIADYVRPRVDNIVQNIRKNLQSIDALILKYNPQKIKLFISDFYWISNNIIYTHLIKRFGKNFTSALFDEGCALYTRQDLLLRDRVRSIIKWCAFKMIGMPYQILHNKSFDHNNENVQEIYCYHPELFEGKRRTKAVELQTEMLQPYLNTLDPVDKPRDDDDGKGTLLFLSQPYFYHMPIEQLKKVMQNLSEYFRTQGVTEFFFKPHHLDGETWTHILQNELSFKKYAGNSGIGIEISARHLDFEYVVAFSSSALLNLKKFGYQGTVVSYGEKQFAKHKETRRINQNIAKIFRKKGVLVIG